MGGLLKAAAKKAAAKASEKIAKTDPSHPVTQDTTAWALSVAKHAIELFF